MAIRTTHTYYRAMSWPQGVPPRERRPGLPPAGGAVLGGIIGGILSGGIGLAIGGALGALASEGKLPLEAALRKFAQSNGGQLVSLRRHGPRVATAVVGVGHGYAYYRLDAEAPSDGRLSDEDVEDWLYGELKAQFALVAARERAG